MAGEDRPAGVVVSGEFSAIRYSSPIPPPEVLEGYERLLSGATDRFMAMAEREQHVRHAEDRTFIRVKATTEILGLVLSYALPGAALWFSYKLAMMGMRGESIAAIMSALGIFIARTYAGAHRRKKADTKPQQMVLPLD